MTTKKDRVQALQRENEKLSLENLGLRTTLKELQNHGWSEQKAIKLSRLEVYSSHSLNIILNDGISDREKVNRLLALVRDELKWVKDAELDV